MEQAEKYHGCGGAEVHIPNACARQQVSRILLSTQLTIKTPKQSPLALGPLQNSEEKSKQEIAKTKGKYDGYDSWIITFSILETLFVCF